MRQVGAKATLVLIDGLGHGYSLRPTVMRQLHNALDAALLFLVGSSFSEATKKTTRS
jgi:hypothetical protein